MKTLPPPFSNKMSRAEVHDYNCVLEGRLPWQRLGGISVVTSTSSPAPHIYRLESNSAELKYASPEGMVVAFAGISKFRGTVGSQLAWQAEMRLPTSS
jgi:hypothetical protein